MRGSLGGFRLTYYYSLILVQAEHVLQAINVHPLEGPGGGQELAVVEARAAGEELWGVGRTKERSDDDELEWFK